MDNPGQDISRQNGPRNNEGLSDRYKVLKFPDQSNNFDLVQQIPPGAIEEIDHPTPQKLTFSHQRDDTFGGQFNKKRASLIII